MGRSQTSQEIARRYDRLAAVYRAPGAVFLLRPKMRRDQGRRQLSITWSEMTMRSSLRGWSIRAMRIAAAGPSVGLDSHQLASEGR